jgi:hypothetical protein
MGVALGAAEREAARGEAGDGGVFAVPDHRCRARSGPLETTQITHRN